MSKNAQDAIQEAMYEVEKLGASEALTKVINLLAEAKKTLEESEDIETPPKPPPKP